MSTRDEVKSRFITLLAPYVRRETQEPIPEDACLADDLHVNSARFVDIILESEEHFEISIDDAAAERMRTVSDAIDVILERVAVHP
jgi:acyl carrier protein